MSERDTRSHDTSAGGSLVPLVPLRDIVVFPHTMVPFVVGRKSSLMAVELALAGDKTLPRSFSLTRTLWYLPSGSTCLYLEWAAKAVCTLLHKVALCVVLPLGQ